jgi:hypothetical protein
VPAEAKSLQCTGSVMCLPRHPGNILVAPDFSDLCSF